MKLARTRPGEEKMSAVLLDFLRPYLHYAKTREAFERLIVLAILAWNGAINPESNWEEVIHKGLPGLTLIERQEVKAMVAEMIARKQRYFAGNQRLILSYSVMDTPAGWDVSVASTLGEPERKATS